MRGERYLQKVSKYAGCDLYLLKKTDFSKDLKDLPAIEAVDITKYLVLRTSLGMQKYGGFQLLSQRLGA